MAAITSTAAPALTSRASLTAAALLFDYVVRLAVGVLLTPVVVSHLGRSLFGVWEMLMRLVGYMTLADGRPMDALRLVLASQQGVADDRAKQRALATAIYVWGGFLPIAVIAGAALVWAAPQMAHAMPGEAGTIRVAAAVLVGNFLLLALVALPEAALFGTNQGYRRIGIAAAVNLIGAGLTVVLLRRGGGLVGLASVQIVVTLLTAAVYLGVARRHIAWFALARPQRQEVIAFARFSGWSLAGDSLAKLMLASDVLLLGVLTSAAMVTSYVLTSYAAQAVVGVLTLVLGAAVPGLADVIGRREFARAERLRAELLALAWLAATVVGTLVLLWNRAFIAMWVGADHYAGAAVNALLVVIMLQTVLIRTETSFINAALRPRERVQITSVAALLSCGLAIVLIPSFGIAGLCAGLVAGRLAQSIGFPMLVNATLGRAQLAGWSTAVRPAAATTLLFSGASLLGSQLTATSWSAWMSGVVGSFVITLPLAMVAGLPSPARLAAVARVRTLYHQLPPGGRR